MNRKTLMFILISLGMLLWSARGYAQSAQLNAIKVTKGPALDGKVDALWKDAKEIKTPVTGGANLPGGGTEVTLKAVYTDEDLFILAQWADKIKSERRTPWQKQKDGTWLQLKDPNDKGGTITFTTKTSFR